MAGPEDCAIIVQALGGQCIGVEGASLVVPVRLLVAGDVGGLLADLTGALLAHGTAGTPRDEWWPPDPGSMTHDVLVVGFGAPRPDPDLVDLVGGWSGSVVAILPAKHDPRTALPDELRTTHALNYEHDAAEVLDDVLDVVLLGHEERRAFISYAHRDGRQVAFDLFHALTERRYDVYLDRFRTEPSTDFVERIDDELLDKAMIVVVETAAAAESTWVLHEIMAAKRRGHGLVSVLPVNGVEHPLIDEVRRLRLADLTMDEVRDLISSHHRFAVGAQRRRRANQLRLGLSMVARPRGLHVATSGDRCVLTGGSVAYSVLGTYRPAGLHQARRSAETAAAMGARPAVYCPRPARSSSAADLGWVDGDTPVAVVPDGHLLHAAAHMVGGTL